MKAITFIILCILSFSSLGQNTITTNTLTQTSFCAGGNIIVQYSSTGTFPLGCVFNAELSDATGNFTNSVIIGSMPLNTGVVAGTIPSNTTFGFGYRVRVTATNPITIGSVSSTTLIILNSAISATIVATPSSGVCEGDSVSLWITYNASYYWSTGETTQTIYVTQSGTYTCTVTNYLTGCEVTSNPQNVVVHQNPTVDLGPDIELCNGQNVTLDAGSGLSVYHWNDNSVAQTLNVSSSGIYAVTVSDAFGCNGSDTVNAVFHPNPVVDLGADTNLCGNSILLSAAAGFNTYDWNNGSSFNPSYLVQTSGTYFISVTDANGCPGGDTIQVSIHAIPVINLGNDLSANGTSVTLNAGSGFANYDWNNGAGSEQYFTVTVSGDYFVEVTDQYSCFNSDTIHVTIYPPAGSETFLIYPNPFQEALHIVSSENLTKTSVVFYDMLGRYYLPEFTVSSTGMLINRNSMPAGCYVLLLENNEGLHYAGKFIMY